MKHLLFVAATVALMTGCAAIPSDSEITFHYKPSSVAAAGPKLPATVAVLPFKDGTGNFTILGSMFDPESLTFNLAKSGIAGIITPLTPDLWAKAFADDMAASGSFRAVRFMYSPTELSDEEFYIEGTLEKAYAAGGYTKPSEYALLLQAVRRSDNRPAWQKKVTREMLTRKLDFDPCGTKIQCMADRSHEGMNTLMQGMFAEAREDFMASQGLAKRKSPEINSATTVTPLDPESVDETIEMILKGK